MYNIEFGLYVVMETKAAAFPYLAAGGLGVPKQSLHLLIISEIQGGFAILHITPNHINSAS